MDYTQTIGNVNELQCMIAFMSLGYDCSIPYGNSSKYDFIVDLGDQFIKIQCKSSHYVRDNGIQKDNAFIFSTTTSTSNTKETVVHKYNNQQIDYFATYFNNKVYVIPFSECSGLSNKTLRLEPPANGMLDYNKAEDYEIENLFPKSEQYLQSKEKYLNRNLLKPEKITNPELFKCPECGKEVSEKGNLCVSCAKIKSRKVERPNRDILKELIRNTPFVQIGKMYGVTDNSIRKWCKFYDLPSKTSEIKSISDQDWDTV